MPSLTPSVLDAYWAGQPMGQSSVVIYGSARGGLVSSPSSDGPYQAWLALGYTAWPWPKDDTGAITTAALDAILASYGLPLTELTPPTKAQLVAYANAKVAALRATPRLYNLGAASFYADASTDTIAMVSGLADWGAANPTATQDWLDDFGATTPMTGAESVALKSAGLAYIQSLYAIAGTAYAGIASAAIATYAAIDALAWPA